MTIGVDISKANLDVHRLPDGEYRQFANHAAGFKALLKWLKGEKIERVVYEATGPYHRAFERTLARAGLVLCRVNPLQARRFAQANGKRAKTDKIDAAMLAFMGIALAPEAVKLPGETLETMREFVVAREALLKDRTAANNRLKQRELPLLHKQAKQRLRHVEGQLKAIEGELQALVNGAPEIRERFDILCSIPAISAVTAWILLVEMPELGTLDQRQVASLAGLAPVTRQSGDWHGRSFIQGGRGRLRQGLYFPAVVAIRYNPDMKIFYERLKAAGKPSKVALTAVMRKLLVTANALLRDGRKWTAK